MTIRDWLKAVDFDFSTGSVIFQGPSSAERDSPDDPRLTTHFEPSAFVGWGDDTPHFIAEDSRAIYFLCQDDSGPPLEVVLKDLNAYLDWEANRVPYPDWR